MNNIKVQFILRIRDEVNKHISETAVREIYIYVERGILNALGTLHLQAINNLSWYKK